LYEKRFSGLLLQFTSVQLVKDIHQGRKFENQS